MRIEPLELRRHFDVTVTEGYPGFWEIRGDAHSNVIVAQLNMEQRTMTLDGVTYNNVSYAVAHGNGGNDFISITSADGLGNIAAAVVAGEGNDVVTLGVDGAVYAGGGNDELYLLDSFRGEAYGEGGNDYMYISGYCVDAEIRGGDGADFINCSSSFFGVVVFGEGGNDTIHGSAYNDEIHGGEGDDSIDAGEGNDMIYAAGGGNDYIAGADGYDVAYVDGGDSADVEQVYYV